MATNLYAVDGLCHNANSGSYGHECGRPADWLGTSRTGFVSGYCDHCKQFGTEARGVVTWVRIADNAAVPVVSADPFVLEFTAGERLHGVQLSLLGESLTNPSRKDR